MDNPLDETPSTPSKKLSKKQLNQLASFTDPGTILATLAKEDWTIEGSIGLLVKIAKEAGKESVRLGAIKYLNQLVIDSMKASGMIVAASKQFTSRFTDRDGQQLQFTGRVVSSSLKSQKEGPSDETQPEELLTPSKMIGKFDEQDSEEKEEEKEEKKEEGNQTDKNIDMSICKPPEGTSDAAGQFGGIAVASSDPGTINFL